MRLFRYLDTNGLLLSIVERQLKVSRLLDLNDAFEWRFGVSGIPEEGEREMEGVIEQCIAAFGAKFGLICFSASPCEPVLWSHYADRHRGGVLKLELNDNPEICVRVEYDDQRPQFDAQEVTGADWRVATHRVFNRLWRQKSKGWAYEQEYRYYVPLAECVQRNGMYFTPLVERMLRRVILGWRSSIQEETIKNLLRGAGYPSCEVVRGRVAKHSYAVEC